MQFKPSVLENNFPVSNREEKEIIRRKWVTHQRLEGDHWKEQENN